MDITMTAQEERQLRNAIGVISDYARVKTNKELDDNKGESAAEWDNIRIAADSALKILDIIMSKYEMEIRIADEISELESARLRAEEKLQRDIAEIRQMCEEF